MSERHMRSRVVLPALAPLGGFAVENRAEPGTPDVVTSLGVWLELKEVPEPGDLDRVLRVPHFRPEQRARIEWMVERGHDVRVLLKVGKAEWILLEGVFAARWLGERTLRELRSNAQRVWRGTGGLVSEEGGLCAYLRESASGSGGAGGD